MKDVITELDVTPSFLSQLEVHETPFRIQNSQTVYYVLTMEQVLTLMQPTLAMQSQQQFTAEDFGLTEEDINTYFELRHKRQAHINVAQQTPLTTDLQNRLDIAQGSRAEFSANDQLMQELEATMLQNLQKVIPNMEQ